MPPAAASREDRSRDPAPDRRPVLHARSDAAAPSGSRLPDGTVRGRVARAAVRRRLIRVEQHPYGPRVYVLGQRVHEVALGIVILALVAVLLAARRSRPDDELLAGLAAGAWLVVKDWRDLFSRWRNTQVHRRFGVHARARAGRGRPRVGVPDVAAAATLLAALLNAGSALTPNVAWRSRLLHALGPVAGVPVFHAVALPLSVLLALTAVSLRRRRRRALQLAVALLALLALLDVLKGLDVEEALTSAALAGALWYARASFPVAGAPLALRRAALPASLAGLALLATGAVSVWVAGGADPSVRLALDQAASLLAWRAGPLPTAETLALPVHALLLAALAAAAATAFAPRAPVPSGDPERRRARELVRRHGRDTLAAFKLRSDLDYLFSPDGHAFLGYRVEGGVLLAAGDPVGPPDALSALLDRAHEFAELHGLRLGVLGASRATATAARAAGLRALYLGDEAILDLRSFSLQGRAIRKVRQSVSRLAQAGYTTELVDAASLGPSLLRELQEVSCRWRAGKPERGFAMAIALEDPGARAGVVVLARDGEGRVRGWLHFLPSFGRPAMSLASMRRDPATPNGLMEFLVVRAAEALRARGVAELSLNFAAFARPLRSPRGYGDRVLARLLGVAGRRFQIESLYRFNAKFFPRWEPRYLLYQSAAALPRIGLAALLAEGQVRLPTPLGRRARASATA